MNPVQQQIYKSMNSWQTFSNLKWLCRTESPFQPFLPIHANWCNVKFSQNFTGHVLRSKGFRKVWRKPVKTRRYLQDAHTNVAPFWAGIYTFKLCCISMSITFEITWSSFCIETFDRMLWLNLCNLLLSVFCAIWFGYLNSSRQYSLNVWRMQVCQWHLPLAVTCHVLRWDALNVTMLIISCH